MPDTRPPEDPPAPPKDETPGYPTDTTVEGDGFDWEDVS
jgi:hypothetical protein